MDFYIPDVVLADYERMARTRVDRMNDDRDRFVTVHANVLLGLIETYRDARKRELQQREQK